MSTHAPPFFESKIIDRDVLVRATAALARPVVFTNGVFDILHRGHVTYLSRARALGASLFVAINSDASVRELGKGSDRPLNTAANRATIVAAIESVTMVTVFTERVPLAVLQIVRPDVYVKGGDYDMEGIPEAALVRTWGAETVAIPFEHQFSTTELLQRIRAGDR
ncbi:MAG TPA: adenylyltransferase/cytidyltransferase family protein [Burkholderiaceae bacterium]|nr:adenylyltransferase/cytidyltransferase family protein [Burkholderiaceae bacterium]